MANNDAPEIPVARLHWGDHWHAQWQLAHRMMDPWHRVPSMHLIDDIAVDKPADRGWLGTIYDLLAATTHLAGGVSQDDGCTRWQRVVTRHDTLETVTIRVVLGSDQRTIVTAFQQ